MGDLSFYQRLSTDETLEDLASRFLVNLPLEEQKSLERICFQVEQAHWFYDDFVRPQNFTLPGFSLRTFCQALLRASGLEVEGDIATAYERFQKYKSTVPVCGAIMLNESLDKCVLVKGYKSNSSWTFPRGKINQNEAERDCAVREVWEETGYDISPYFDPSVAPRPSTSKMGPAPLRADIELDDMIAVNYGESRLKLFIVPGVPEATAFETRTRREIGKIAWFPIASLATHQNHAGRSGGASDDYQLSGNKFYMVAPAVKPLRAWIKRYKKAKRATSIDRSASASPLPVQHDVQSSEAELEEANKALQALFFGVPAVSAALPSASVRHEAVPGDVRILRNPAKVTPTVAPAPLSPTGLLDDAERKRQQAAVLSALFDITKADSPVEPLKSEADPLEALFALASRGNKRPWSPPHDPSLKANGSRPRPSHSPERQIAGEQLLSSLRASQPASSMPVNGYHAYASMPPAMPHQTMLPPYPATSVPAPMHYQPIMHALPPVHGGPFQQPAALPLHLQMPAFVQAPPVHYQTPPVTVSTTGPPLQPTPRRPITLLDHVASPPPTVASSSANADALLSLLNLGPARL